MRVSEFSFYEEDSFLEKWLYDKLGSEVFSPHDGALEKHLRPYKAAFKDIPKIIIGGTNGKGEVSLLLEELFLRDGFDTGLWTSPHVLSVRERFSYGGAPIASGKLLEIFKKVEEDTKTLGKLSYYEFLFVCFCEGFLRLSQLEAKRILLFEVGLGGRLDATNFFDCDGAIITSIGRDHCEFLGDDLFSILKEKIEICRQGKWLISGVEQKFLTNHIHSFSLERNISSIQLEDDYFTSFKKKNIEIALTAYFQFVGKERNEALRESLSRVPLFGRPFNVTYKNTRFILLGSHNLDSLRSLVQWVLKVREHDPSFYFDNAWIGTSRKPGKELDQFLSYVAQAPCLGREVIFSGFSHPRQTGNEEVEASWKRVNQGRSARFEYLPKWENIHQAKGVKFLPEFMEKPRNDFRSVLCFGSHFFIAEILRYLYSQEKELT